MLKMYVLLVMFFTFNFSWAGEINFYANGEIQSRHPQAFATSPATVAFHKALEASDDIEKKLITEAISQRPGLLKKVLNFEVLETEKQIEVLWDIFLIECSILKITPPALIIDETSIPGFAYFEFDYETGGPGKVFLNLKKLKETKNKSEFIVLLLHETRHSAQFQMSQRSSHDPLSIGYEAAFRTQKELKSQNVKLSFCDFMLLLNEFEAFQFANYIYGALTGWNTPINDMGTLASQYDHEGKLRLNLLHILEQSPVDAVEQFNSREVIQYKELYESLAF